MKQNPFAWLTVPKTQKTLLLTCLWFVMLIVALWLQAILIPFILAALIAYVLNPVVEHAIKLKIKGKHLPKGVIVLFIYAVVITILTLFFAFFVPEIYSEIVRLAKFLADEINKLNETYLQNVANNMEAFFRRNGIPIHMIGGPNELKADGTIQLNLIQLAKDLLKEIADYFAAQSTHILSQMQSIITGLIRFIFEFFLVLMISAFILSDTERIKRFLFRLVATEDRSRFDNLLSRIDTGLSGVVRGQLIICLINGVLTLIGLLLLKIKFAFVLATIAGVLSFVPIFGSIISTLPIVIVALTSGPLPALLSLMWIVAIHALEANLLNPKILGNSAKIHPVLVVLALIAGEHYFGIAGAVLAVPVASIMLTLFHSVLNRAQSLDSAVAK